MAPGGFVDLRLNRDENRGNENFWPSFTDIMTVVVLIFLIAMVVVLLRNMELVQELRATLAAEREAMALARAAGEEKQSLADRLEEAQEQLGAADRRIAELEERLQRLEEENEIRARAVADRDRQLDQLAAEKSGLERRLAELQDERDRARRAASEREDELTRLREMRDRLQEALSRRELQVAALRSRLEAQDEQLRNVREARRQVEEKYLALADRYDTLKLQYDKLVRPARSPQGRHLVEVRYFKGDGQPRIEWREGGQGAFSTVSLAQLERRLEALKEAHPEGLYVKVILPNDSGLSFSEAWRFTNRLHRRYDYYYQAEAGPTGETPDPAKASEAVPAEGAAAP